MSTSIPGAGRLRQALRQLQIATSTRQTHLKQRWYNRSGETTPVFLVGCGRSGTSMLAYHLARSWRLELYNEDNPAAFDRWRLRELPVIAELVERSYAPFVLFKPILDTYKTQHLLDRFPTAKFIFVFRHYDDVINSSIRRFGAENRIGHVNAWMNDGFGEFAALPPPESTQTFIRSLWKSSLSAESGAALFWLFQNRLFFDLALATNQRVRLAGYESIVARPDDELAQLCRFLGIPFEPHLAAGIFASSVNRHTRPQLDPEIEAACAHLWQRLCQHSEA